VRGKPGTAVQPEPRQFIVCFEGHGHAAGAWSVKTRQNWIHADEISILVPVLTVYKGPTAPQPRAYLTGFGVVTRRGRTLVITS
jgi:hypothetical protein